jgi:PAS domain S-box-containing protein
MQTNVDMNALVEAFGDAVVVCDAHGLITLWNPAAAQMFGFSEQEALGKTLDLIIPERLRKRHNEGYEHSMATGTTRYGHDLLRVPAINSFGAPMSIAFTVAMLKASDGSVTGVAAVIRDETVRFSEERALKKRISELEALIPAASLPVSSKP